METVTKIQESSDIFEVPKSSLSPNGNKLTIEVCGQTTDRSFEDRNVFININGNTTAWLQAEDAIRLGQILIKHGSFAFMANMVNHQQMHMRNRLTDLIKSGAVKAINFTVIDEHPANYGKGFRTYNVTPEWVEGCEPKYERDFNFDTVIYWSPFEEDFKTQKYRWSAGVSDLPINIHGYDWEAELENFNKRVKGMK